MADFLKDFALDEHPIYAKRKEEWTLNEAVHRGGNAVREKLVPFYWEEHHDPKHFTQRKKMATVVPFASRMTEKFVGGLADIAPTPSKGMDFGTLGEVRTGDEFAWPYANYAEMLYYDCDRKGNSWPSFFNHQQRLSMVTGHRWVGVEVPQSDQMSFSLDDAMRGKRPYTVGFSPLHVPNWLFVDGRLVALAIRLQRHVLVHEGQYKGESIDEYLVYVAQEFDVLGDEYAAGGWWLLDEDGHRVTRGEGEEVTGDLSATGGEIPYAPLHYMIDDEEFSKAGTGEMSAIEISYMNLSSAGDNDALEGGGRTQHILGTRVDEYNQAVDQKKEGSRWIAWQPFETNSGTVVPQIWDSASVSAESSIESALERKRKEAAIIAADELQAGPNASGEARYMEFLDVKLPRLTLMAMHREGAEQQALHYAEMLFGASQPTGRVSWPTSGFDLETDVQDWERIFNSVGATGFSSPTLIFVGLQDMLDEKGKVLPDEVWEAIKDELVAEKASRVQQRSFLGSLGDSPPEDEADDEGTGEADDADEGEGDDEPLASAA